VTHSRRHVAMTVWHARSQVARSHTCRHVTSYKPGPPGSPPGTALITSVRVGCGLLWGFRLALNVLQVWLHTRTVTTRIVNNSKWTTSVAIMTLLSYACSKFIPENGETTRG
jgi:hypothetical protein